MELAAGAWSKSIIGRVNNGGTFAGCNTSGVYLIAIADSATVADFPKVNGTPIYSYGMMIVTVGEPCISQLYMSHRGHIAVRQSWDSGKEYQEWFVQYSSVNKPSAIDVGALPITGGKVGGEIHADKYCSKTSFNLGEGVWGERHGMLISGKDNASFDENNLEILSWYGIGLKSTLDNQTRIFLNTRNGDIGIKGSLLVGENDNSLKIHSNNTANSPVSIYTFADTHAGGVRNVVLEAADNKGWLWYSQRLTSGQIEFAVNGKIFPNDYSNFDSRYVQDIRLGSVEHAQLWMAYGYSDTPPYVITAVINDGNDEPDRVSRRPLQKLINGTWYNIGAL
ncbi:tail fiber protein [Xenorhabdus bovienii]|uniref:tail fiber protein n=1 Tax=Xenorhabdus bovienii TaxID=40576 RepID=UPI00056DC693|nr:tail fiber protein [Xenorhabdus bovienii]